MRCVKKVFLAAVSVVFLITSILLTGCAGKETLPGTWKSEDGTDTVYVFNEDGTGVVSLGEEIAISLTYTLDGDKIKISREIFGTKEETSYTYFLEKKKLTLTENGKSVTFVKE